MTVQEAREFIGKRTCWLGVDEVGKNYDYSLYKKRPLTTYAYWLGTEEAREKAAIALSEFSRVNSEVAK